MKSGKGFIYLIRNNVNGKGYVGQTVQTVSTRWNQHTKSARTGGDGALSKSIRKHGVENFTIKEVVSCDPLLLNDLEIHYIEFYGTFATTGHGYNLTKGGSGVTPNSRSNQSEVAKGRKRSPESIAKTAAGNRGKKHPPRSPEWYDKRVGKKMSPESVARMSAAKRGKPNKKQRKYLPCIGGCGTMLTAIQREKGKCPTCGVSNRTSRARPGGPKRGTKRKELPCINCDTLLSSVERKGKCPHCGTSNRTEGANAAQRELRAKKKLKKDLDNCTIRRGDNPTHSDFLVV